MAGETVVKMAPALTALGHIGHMGNVISEWMRGEQPVLEWLVTRNVSRMVCNAGRCLQLLSFTLIHSEEPGNSAVSSQPNWVASPALRFLQWICYPARREGKRD
jgi:hypothetical protein